MIHKQIVFSPGTDLGSGIPSDSSLGFPLVTVLQNIGDPSPASPTPSIINDICSPFDSVSERSGETGTSAQLFVNPAEGSYDFTLFAQATPDKDGDSYENQLDTCPLTPNVGNPRIVADGDVDSDGLDQACDPNDSPAGGTNSDEDADGYQNRNDNCPLVANGEEEDNQADTDRDYIGDACDPTPTLSDTAVQVVQLTSKVLIGSGIGPGSAPTPAQCPNCWRPGIPPVVRQGGVRCGMPSIADVMDMLVFASRLGTGVIPGCLTIAAQDIAGYKWGDVNCDGNVDALDALFILAHFVGVDLAPVGPNCVPIGGLMGSNGQHVETAYEAALRITNGHPAAQCPIDGVVVHGSETSNSVTEPRGLATFGLSTCGEPGAGLILGRTSSGEWKTFLVTQNFLRPATMPASAYVCGSSATIYASPDVGSQVVGSQPVGSSVSLQEFILAESAPQGTEGSGWYRASSPVVGWIDSHRLRPNLPCF
jgi:hypothetical protein